MRAEIWL